jgi:hypothetical protein
MDYDGVSWPPANCLDGDPVTFCSTYGYFGRDPRPSINVSYPCPGGSTALSKVVVVPRQGQDSLSAFQLDFRNAAGATDAPSANFAKQQKHIIVPGPSQTFSPASQAPAGPGPASAASAAGSGPAGENVTVTVSLAAAIPVVVVVAAAMALVCVRRSRRRSASSSAGVAKGGKARQQVRFIERACGCVR